MPPHLIVLEGPDGVGKSAHAALLTASLRARGIDARLFQHVGPARGAGLVEAALHFAHERAVMLRTEKAPVVVADRWIPSSMVAFKGAADPREHSALRDIAEAEVTVTPEPRLAVLLTASNDVLDARLRARGAEPSTREMQDREVYAFLVERARADGDSMPRNGAVVDTARPQDEVAAEILALALRALEGVAR